MYWLANVQILYDYVLSISVECFVVCVVVQTSNFACKVRTKSVYVLRTLLPPPRG